MPRSKLTWTLTGSDADGAVESVRGISRDQFSVAFQPIVNIFTGRLFAYEALVRCSHPRYPTPPVLFDAAVREEACGRLGRLIREIAFDTCGPNALFVNVHPQELASRWLVKPDDPIGFHENDVFLEITESAAFEQFDLCMGVLKELCRRTGTHLVVDDFGAGYSNLARVADLAPSVVKLDIVLTRDIHRVRARQVVVRHMVAMCRELGAIVIAEGVEKPDELRCVRDLGIQYAQGYLLAHPATPPPPHSWPVLGESAFPSARRRPSYRSAARGKTPSKHPENAPASQGGRSSATRSTKPSPRR